MRKLSLLVLLGLFCLTLAAKSDEVQLFEPNPPVQHDPTGPYNLTAEVIDTDNILFVWDNPVFNNQPMGFRIYCSTDVAADIGGQDVCNYFLQCVCEGCHYFYVVAYYDTGCESAPSNVVQVTITSNEDGVAVPNDLVLSVHPNPSRSQVEIRLNGSKDPGAVPVSIYNMRGQLVRTVNLKDGQSEIWNGCDQSGKPTVPGIYYLKAVTKQGTVVRKLIRQ